SPPIRCARAPSSIWCAACIPPASPSSPTTRSARRRRCAPAWRSLRRASAVAELSLDDYDYALPVERIAQQPAPEREAARLLVLDRATGARQRSRVSELAGLLRAGDLLVVNATRVLPARLRGEKASGGRVEALLLGPLPGHAGSWRALLRGRGRLRPGAKLRFGAGEQAFDAELTELRADGEVVLSLAPGISPYRAGETPLPPYIRRSAPDALDVQRYH